MMKRGMLNKRGNKRGQVTLFIIIAVVIVAVVVLFIVLRGRMEREIPIEKVSFDYFINCIKQEFDYTYETVLIQGGYIEPTNYVLRTFDGSKVGYLCYTKNPDEACVMHKPFVKSFIQSEIENYIKDRSKECIKGLEEVATKSNFVLSAEEPTVEVNIRENLIQLDINCSMTLTKGEETIRKEQFSFSKPSNFLELTQVSQTILFQELGEYHDFWIDDFNSAHTSLAVEKERELDGSEIYIITSVKDEEKFILAIRNYVPKP